MPEGLGPILSLGCWPAALVCALAEGGGCRVCCRDVKSGGRGGRGLSSRPGLTTYFVTFGKSSSCSEPQFSSFQIKVGGQENTVLPEMSAP